MTTYRLFPSTKGPSTPASYGSNPIVVGVQFQVTTGGCWLDGYWWWVCPTDQPTKEQTFALWQVWVDNVIGNLIAAGTVASGTLKAGEWNFVPLSTPVPLSIGATYIAATGLTGDFPTTNNEFGGTGPYRAGITQGPLFAYSDITSNGGSAPSPAGLQQAVYSTAGSDPTKYMPAEGSNSQNLWIDVEINTNAPADASYRLWPNYPIIAGSVSQDPEPQSFGTEFKLSAACTLNKLWFYSPPTVTQLPTACAIYEISSQTIVSGTSNGSPTWSGAAGSGWVSCDYTGVTLPAGDYKATIYYSGDELFYQENTHYFSTPQTSVESVARSLSTTAWWELADAAGSTTAADSSGNKHTGTVNGGVTFGETGPLEGGTTATFNGTTGYLSTGLNFSSAWTALSFAAFARIPSGTAGPCGVVGSNNAASGGGAFLQLVNSGGSLALQFNVGTTSATFVSSASWADGNWHHVAISWDGSTAIGYLDGDQIGSSGTAFSASVTAGSADVAVGSAGGNFFTGGLAHVLITNWALSTANGGDDADDAEPADAVDALYYPSLFTTGPGWNGVTAGPLSSPSILNAGLVIGNWTNLNMTGNSSYSNPNSEFIYPDLYDVKDGGENRWVDVEVTPVPVIVPAHAGALLAVFP
jgi:Concanavalin A-like lectin/glucanases superfamily/Domain of unknown function (DUF4082)